MPCRVPRQKRLGALRPWSKPRARASVSRFRVRSARPFVPAAACGAVLLRRCWFPRSAQLLAGA
eukprot:3656544-Lingulodinium_polyedra.AAC.1